MGLYSYKCILLLMAWKCILGENTHRILMHCNGNWTAFCKVRIEKKNFYHVTSLVQSFYFIKILYLFQFLIKKRAQLAQQMYNFFYTDWNIFYFYTSARWHLYDPDYDRRQRPFCSYSQAQWKNMNINNAAIISYYLLKNKWCHIWWKFFFIYTYVAPTKLFIVDFCIYLYLNKLLTSSFG